MIVKLNNDVELECILVNGQSRYFQGSNRDTLEFQFAKNSITFDILDALFGNPENTSRIIITDNNGSFLHSNYSLRVEMNLSNIIIAPATDVNPEITEERFTVVMAQKSYQELQIERLQSAVDALIS